MLRVMTARIRRFASRVSVAALALTLPLANGCGPRAESNVTPTEANEMTKRSTLTTPTTPATPATPTAPNDPNHAARGLVPDVPPEVAHPYDEAADATAMIDDALVVARGDRKSVLLVFGANWCPWCRRLEHTLTHHPEVVAELARNFHVVHVDTGARGTGKNAAVASRYGDPTRLGLPVLVVLTPDGQLKATQETGALEVGDRHDPAALLAFLARVRS